MNKVITLFENAKELSRYVWSIEPWQNIIFSIVFSLGYVLSAAMHHQSFINSTPKALVFRARILLPETLNYIVPSSWIDSIQLRFSLALIFSFCALTLSKNFFKILNTSQEVRKNYNKYVFTILLLHYVFAQTLNVYYVNDIPSIFFYLLSFSLLTNSQLKIFFLGIFLALVFSTNRETISIVVFHTLGLVAWDLIKKSSAPRYQHITIRATALTLLLISITLLKNIILYKMGGDMTDSNSLYEDGKLRIISNLYKITHEPRAFVQIFIFGGGVLLWIPHIWNQLHKKIKFVVLSSIPISLPLVLASNIRELRVFNEFVPLLSILYGYFFLKVKNFFSDSSLKKV